jgi:hypothetical protein
MLGGLMPDFFLGLVDPSGYDGQVIYWRSG